jgi:glycosyltransferase involved in cell wall biosynthesis
VPESILIATVMRPHGDTGVQSHFLAFLAWAQQRGVAMALVTPFDRARWQVAPVFALRRLIDPLHKSASVRWYRHWHALFLGQALRLALADGRPRTVYAQCPLAAVAALRARTTPLQRVVMVVHFNISQADEWADKGMIRKGGALYAAIRGFEADLLPRLDGVVYVSDFMRREVAQRIPAAGKLPTLIAPNFLSDPGPPAEFPAHKADLICIGTLEPRKNQRHALQIVAAAARLGRALHLTVVGDGPDRRRLEALASQLGIRQQVVFTGSVLHAAELIPGHSALLHVARMENFGIVLVEAMAHGLPVFAPAVGGVPEVFSDGCEGRHIPIDDAQAAARIIIDWLDSPQTMALAKRAARARFVERFEAAKVAADLADFLHRALAREPGSQASAMGRAAA